LIRATFCKTGDAIAGYMEPATVIGTLPQALSHVDTAAPAAQNVPLAARSAE
jgi:hypothetical protein